MGLLRGLYWVPLKDLQGSIGFRVAAHFRAA